MYNWGGGMQSKTHGYGAGGGYTGVGIVNVIQKFAFGSSSNSSDIADLTQSPQDVAGASSTTHGYRAGGRVSGSSVNVIDKFSTTSDANATDVGYLTQSVHFVAGCQY